MRSSKPNLLMIGLPSKVVILIAAPEVDIGAILLVHRSRQLDNPFRSDQSTRLLDPVFWIFSHVLVGHRARVLYRRARVEPRVVPKLGATLVEGESLSKHLDHSIVGRERKCSTGNPDARDTIPGDDLVSA